MVSLLAVDSTVLIDQFRGHPDAARLLAPLLDRNAVALHPVLLAEILTGARDAKHRRSLDEALAPLVLLRVKSNDFVAAIDLQRAHQLRAGIGWEDCLIAATCLRLGIPLLTTNDKHFSPIARPGVIRAY